MSKSSPELIERIRKLALEGKSSKDIGRIVGKSPKAIQKLFSRHNLPHLPRGAQKGQKNHFWKTGKVVDKNGYRLIYTPGHLFVRSGRYVLEHRLVMESHLKRYLTPLEVVHHKNKNKLDNRIENLELFSKNSEHLKVELSGQVPKWSEDGIRRIQEGVQNSVSKRKASDNQKG